MSVPSIVQVLAPTNTPVARAKYNQTADTYIVFLEYNEDDALVADNRDLATKHYFQIDVFSNGDFTQLVKDVKSLMLDAGFKYMFGSETYDEDFGKYRKIMRFSYTTDIAM